MTRARSRALGRHRSGSPRRAATAAIAALAAACLGAAAAGGGAGASGASESHATPEREARQWYLGGHAGGPATTSTLYLLNAGVRAADVQLREFTSSGAPMARSLRVAPGSLEAISLDDLGRAVADGAFWVQVLASEPVLPQIVQFARARRDGAIETLEVASPIAGPLDDGHRDWIYPDGFQGGPPPWQERELLSLLNPGVCDGTARLVVRFRDGRPALESAIVLPSGRVASVDLWTRFDGPAAIGSAVQGDYALTVSADVPLLGSQIRRARRQGDDEVRGSRPSAPIRLADARRARVWYYAGGWIVPRDAARTEEDTWQLLFTYGARDEPVRVEATPVTGSGGATPIPLLAPAGRSDLQWLHLDPWREVLGDERPWGLVVRGAGPVAPAVTVAEYEAGAEGLPGSMDGAPLSPEPLASAWWLGVARHGVAAPLDDWAAAWQLLNPGSSPLRVTLHLFASGATPVRRTIDLAGHAVARVTGDDLAARRDGSPFAVVATASGPFLAHAWQRARRPGRSETRALASRPGVAVSPEAVGSAGSR